MSFTYSLRVKPNWDPSYSPAWVDLSRTLIMTQLPSITITAERADTPLVTTVSDLTITVNNADDPWDSIFDSSKIIGPLPPTSGTIRAPLTHYGQILLCRKTTLDSNWEVLFYGFITPSSVIFNRQDKTVSITAYAAGTLLEKGNAERVHRFSDIVAARPFWIPYELDHPVSPPNTTGTPDNTWWRIVGASALPFFIGDQFQAIQDPVTWVENQSVVTLSNTVFNVIAVARVGADLYLQTDESELLAIAAGTGRPLIATPWWQGQTWEFLVAALVAEVNAALASLGSSDVITVDVTDVPLLPSNVNQIVAQRIYSADIPPIINGVAVGEETAYAPIHTLLITRTNDQTTAGEIDLKPNILQVTVASNPGFVFHSPSAPPGYIQGPDEGIAERLLSPQVIIPGQYPFAASPVTLVGQDLLQYNLPPGLFNSQFWYATHWIRTPTSYGVGFSDPVRCYRIFSHGDFDDSVTPNQMTKGTQISEFISSDFGATWTCASNVNSETNYPLSANGAGPRYSSSNRPSIKVFKLGSSSFLYCWVDPMVTAGGFLGGNFVKHSTDDAQAASFMLPPPASFITPGDPGFGILSSSFVFDGTNVFFFADRLDGTAVDLWYWNGSAMAAATITNSSGVALPLHGGDFINAFVDLDTGNNLLHFMTGSTLVIVQYTFSGSTMTVTNVYTVAIDTPNYDPQSEINSVSVSNPGAIAWLSGKINQHNVGEPDYNAAPIACIVGTQQAVYIASSAPSNVVEYADFTQLSCAGALQGLLILRGVLMLTGADEDFVADPNGYTPVPSVSFRQRLPSGASPVDISGYTEGCQDGLWLLIYNSFGIQNSKVTPPFGPFYNQAVLTDLQGNTFSLLPPRFPGSSSLLVDNPFIRSSFSFAQLLCNYYAQEFVVPRPAASIVSQDPYGRGLGSKFTPLDLVTYLVRPPDSSSPTPIYRTARIFEIGYALDEGLLNLKVQ